MAGTISQSTTKSGLVSIDVFGSKKALKLVFDFVADAATGAIPTTTAKIHGRITKVVFIPGATTPTNNTTLTILDPDTGLDVTFGQCKAASGATAQEFYPVYSPSAGVYVPVSPLIANDAATVAITGNAVHSAAGTFEVYVTNE